MLVSNIDPFVQSLSRPVVNCVTHDSLCFTTFRNTKKRDGKLHVLLMDFKVYGNVVKHCHEYVIYLLRRKLN